MTDALRKYEERAAAGLVTEAEALGMEDRLGVLKPGLQADFLLLEKDPGADLASAIRKPERVIKKGHQV